MYLTLIVLEGDMANVTIDHGVGGEVGSWPRALEQRHGGGSGERLCRQLFWSDKSFVIL